MPSKSKVVSSRKIDIAVGLQWPAPADKPGGFSLKEPWPTIHGILKQAVKSARPASGKQIVVRRLRARAGMSVKSGIIASIRDADILVFDVAPLKLEGNKAKCPANVLFEIGVAIGMGKPVVLIGAGKSPHKSLPSDIQEEFVATYTRPQPRGKFAKQSPNLRTDEAAIRAAIVALAANL